jgi:hypothetical protein
MNAGLSVTDRDALVAALLTAPVVEPGSSAEERINAFKAALQELNRQGGAPDNYGAMPRRRSLFRAINGVARRDVQPMLPAPCHAGRARRRPKHARNLVVGADLTRRGATPSPRFVAWPCRAIVP